MQYSTEEVETANGDHQVEVRTVEAAAGHPGQPEHEAETEEDVEAGGEGAAAGLLGEQLDHGGGQVSSHVTVITQSYRALLVSWW